MAPRRPLLSIPVALSVMVLSAGHGAKAEALDLMRATCADFMAMSGNDQSQLSLWLAGYYAGGAQRALIDIAKIAAAPAELQAVCTKAPQTPLIGPETRAVFMPPAAP